MSAVYLSKRVLRARSVSFVALIVTLSLCSIPVPARAAQDHQHHHHGQAKSEERAKEAPVKTHLTIPDTPVLDQEGRRLNFYTDLVKGRSVAINFIFTTCTTICPPLAATFAKVQKLAGEKSGREFHLISISVDPATDTPPRLKAWSEKFKAAEGWTLVTGNKQDIDNLLKSLGGFSARIEDHSPTVLIGNDERGVWTRAYGLAPPAKLLEVIEGVVKGSITESARREEK